MPSKTRTLFKNILGFKAKFYYKNKVLSGLTLLLELKILLLDLRVLSL